MLTDEISWTDGGVAPVRLRLPSAIFQARLVGLAECWSHAIFDAGIGPYVTSGD